MDEYTYMIIAKMGFSSCVEIQKKKVTQSSRKRRDCYGHRQAWPLLSGRKRNNSPLWLACFKKNPCYQL